MNQKGGRQTGLPTGKLKGWQILLLLVLPVLTALICLSVGRLTLSPAETFRALISGLRGTADPTPAEVTVLRIRLPRVLMALVVGAGLSAAGCAFQSLFANPLATPDTVGVASGASFGAAVGILLGSGMAGIQVASFLSGLLAVALTFFTGYRKGRGMQSVVLAGIMIGSLFSALVSLVKFLADGETELPAITYFLMGSLNGKGYPTLLSGSVPVFAGVLTLFLIRFRMNLLPLSEDEVRSFGVSMRGLRAVTVVAATVICASCVSMCGQVGWIGLLVPHMCRMVFKTDHRALIPASLSVGASFMVIVDTLARSVSASEIPVSVLTAVLGAPFFIYLMKKTGGWKL